MYSTGLSASVTLLSWKRREEQVAEVSYAPPPAAGAHESSELPKSAQPSTQLTAPSFTSC